MVAELIVGFGPWVELEDSRIFAALMAIGLLPQIDQVYVVTLHVHETVVVSELALSLSETHLFGASDLHALLLSHRVVCLKAMLGLFTVLVDLLAQYATLCQHDRLGIMACYN